jgi:predicted RNA-binding protein with PIN domain
MQHFVVDGYNIIHAIPSLKNLLQHDPHSAREELIDDIARLAMQRKFRCTVVFDGSSPQTHPVTRNAPVHVRYSFPVSADEVIKEMIEKSNRRSELVVISADRSITDTARTYGCITHSSKHFAHILHDEADLPDEKPASTLSPGQLKEWLRIFGKK